MDVSRQTSLDVQLYIHCAVDIVILGILPCRELHHLGLAKEWFRRGQIESHPAP